MSAPPSTGAAAAPVRSPRVVTGTVAVHPRGFGFLTPEASDEPGEPLPAAFVTPPELNPFLADDRVRATVTAGADGRWTASGLALVERSRREVFGEVVARRGALFVRVDREVANTDWPLAGAEGAVAPGDAIVARVAGESLALLRRLGPDDDASLARLVARHGLRSEFSPEALAEARAAASLPHALGARRDLREVPTVTVDAPSTRDVDDAVSVLPAGADGALRLLVSIADPAAMIPEGSALDREARERATSAYLAGCVLPMLPDELSSGWLSLHPGQDRLALTVELRIDPEGRVTSADVYESLIRSWARLDYDETAAFLDRGELSAAMAPVAAHMPWFRTASARLGVARARRGGVVLAREEAKITFDAAGEATGVAPLAATSAHVMIERFMVAANEAIAAWLVDRGVPAIFRAHDEPDAQRVADLAAFARNFGYEPGFGRSLTPLAFAAFDGQIAGAAVEPALRAVLRRALGPARYAAEPGPHFGLAAPLYLHFTSPLRRYADLCVHRTLRAYLRGRRDWAEPAADAARLAAHINARARAAARAERDRHRVLTARLMANRLGEVFAVRVTRVLPFGLLVQIDATLVEGVLPFEALPGGPYAPDARETAAVGAERTFTIGAALTVRLASVDEALGRVEFAL